MPIRPHRWTPPKAPSRAREHHSVPEMPEPRVLPLPGAVPEDVVLAPDGRVVTGISGGRILAVDPRDGTVEEIADTGGRPLGLHAEPDGSLLICDSERGLLRLDAPHGTLEVLVGEVNGERLNFASNVVADTDGTIYFSASTRRFPFEDYLGDFYEHSGTGRLFRRTPDGRVETLLDGLQFANGVVLAPDRSHLLVAETAAYRVTRYHLSGPKTGTSDHLVENMPGLPDNMGLGSDGLIWVTLVTPRNPLLDMLLPLPGIVRQVAWALPKKLQPAPARTAWVMAYDFDGTLVHDLQREGKPYALVTGVAERDGTLYLGSLAEAAIATVRLTS